jgi:glucose-1-phosphate cytidylyltransferase
VAFDDDGLVKKVEAVGQSDVWMNGGNFVLSHEIFSHMRHGEELVNEPFQRLIAERRLAAFKYEGFWSCMDTFKEKQHLDEMYARGEARWELWKQPVPEEASPAASIESGAPIESRSPIDETLLKGPRPAVRLRAAK